MNQDCLHTEEEVFDIRDHFSSYSECPSDEAIAFECKACGRTRPATSREADAYWAA